MTFPNSPFGQGSPDQAGHQQPLYTQQAGLPPILSHQQPSGYPGEQPNAPKSGELSGATGIAAAVLAGFGALAGLGSGMLAIAVLAGVAYGSDSFNTGLAVVASVLVLNTTFGLMNAIGAVMLYERKMRGRRLVVGACALAILSTLILFVATAAEASSYGQARGIYAVVTLAFPIATLVLALLPSTRAWIDAKQNPVAAQPYPQYPGWS